MRVLDLVACERSVDAARGTQHGYVYNALSAIMWPSAGPDEPTRSLGPPARAPCGRPAASPAVKGWAERADGAVEVWAALRRRLRFEDAKDDFANRVESGDADHRS